MHDARVRGGAIGGSEGAKVPLKVSKKEKLENVMGYFHASKFKISFSTVIFKEEIHALAGRLSRI